MAAAWSRHDNPLADGLLADSDKFGVVEVLKAVQLLGETSFDWLVNFYNLDTGRRLRVAEKRLSDLIQQLEVRKDMKAAARSRLSRKKIEQQKVVNNLKVHFMPHT